MTEHADTGHGETCFPPEGTAAGTWHYLRRVDGPGDAAVVSARWCGGAQWELSRLRVSASRMGVRDWEYHAPCAHPARSKVADVVVAHARAGCSPREIAELVGWRPESVSSLLSRARSDGEDIPRSPPGRPGSVAAKAKGGSHAR
jgi:hypothetical protein